MEKFRRLAQFVLLTLLLCSGAARAQAIETLVPEQFGFPVGVALDAAGNIFVASDRDNSIIKIPAGGGTPSVFVDATEGLDFPEGLAFDTLGNLYVANSGNGTISLVTPQGAVSVYVAGGIGEPMGLAFDAAGNLYSTDNTGNTIWLTPPGAAMPSTVFASGQDFFNAPIGLAFDAKGNLFVANILPTMAGGGITKVTPDGIASTFVRFNDNGLLFPTFLGFDSHGTLFVTDALGPIYAVSAAGDVASFDTTAFVSPRGLALDRFNDLFVTDIDAATLVELTPNDTATTIDANALAEPTFTTLDSAGNLYVSNPGSRSVTKVTPDGVATPFVLRAAGVRSPSGLAFDANGALFLADAESETIVKVASDGTVTPFVDLSADGNVPQAMVFDAAGTLYVACAGTNLVLKVSPAGTVTQFLSRADGLVTPEGLAFDASGTLFIADAGFGTIVKVTQDGKVSTVVPVSAGLSAPQGIAFDGNGTLYIANSPGGTLPPGIVAVTPSGLISLFEQNVTGLGNPIGLSFLANTLLYAVDNASNSLFQISVPPPIASLPAPLFASVLPGGRSVTAGSKATVFATILNSGAADLANCGIDLAPTAPAALSLSFQPTDNATNQPIGAADQTIAITAKMAQSFILTFTSATALTVADEALVFGCDDVQPAPIIPGVDTVDLVFAATPVADIIAISATAPAPGLQPGVVAVPLSQQMPGAFAVASVNVGAQGVLNVTADTGSATLPVSILLCQTDAATGQCLQPPAATLPDTIPALSVQTFSVFVTATAPIPFAPAASRLFVRFVDAEGKSHGSTSVAIETQ